MVSALAAIFGSFIRAFASTLNAWVTRRHHDRQDLPAKRISHREQLYSDFISESPRVMVDAMQHNFEDPSKLTPVYTTHLNPCTRPSSMEPQVARELLFCLRLALQFPL